jgi:hypothetical protein
MLKVSRTVADLAGRDRIRKGDLLTASNLRALEIDPVADVRLACRPRLAAPH